VLRPIVIGIGDAAVTANPDAELVTYALGSCIAVAAWDPIVRVGGLLHYMLPLSILDISAAQARPFIYGDTALPLLLSRLCELGARRDQLVVCAAGGARVLDEKGIFNIGQKNEEVLRQVLGGFHLRLHEESLGGSVSRTVGLEVASGRFWVREYPVSMAAAGRGSGCVAEAGA
jgi:chemotaxis protein CheD